MHQPGRVIGRHAELVAEECVKHLAHSRMSEGSFIPNTRHCGRSSEERTLGEWGLRAARTTAAAQCLRGSGIAKAARTDARLA
jgi:hypothetical protein